MSSAHQPKPESQTHCAAGAASVDITPPFPVFLYGYPHIPRTSTGVHDPLVASALYLHDGATAIILVSVDIIWLSKSQVARARSRISAALGVLSGNVMISATHTHSGPATVCILSNSRDAAVPPIDDRVINLVEDGIVTAAVTARHNAVAAEIGFAETLVDGIGGNRHDVSGPSIPAVPVLAARTTASDRRLIALLYVFSMHPTVLHEDSTLISSDFPGAARATIQRHFEADHPDLCVLHHLGAAGDQSPRNVTRSNTFSEADRLGELLGKAVLDAISQIEFQREWSLNCRNEMIKFPLRKLPTVRDAEAHLAAARARYDKLLADNASRAELRTAECDYYGAEETDTLANAEAIGELSKVVGNCLPAEIQVIRVGSISLVAWPGEVFVEFAQRVHNQFPHAWIITLANGELQGYLTSSQAVVKRWYEASNAIFASPKSADMLVEATCDLLGQLYVDATSKR